jgi:hypothetical protein
MKKKHTTQKRIYVRDHHPESDKKLIGRLVTEKINGRKVKAVHWIDDRTTLVIDESTLRPVKI